MALAVLASRGIGRAVAIALGGRKINVVVNYLSSASAASDTAKLIIDGGGTAAAFQADVGRADQVRNLVSFCESTFGLPDILVNNAGIIRDTPLAYTGEAEWQEVIDTNLTGVFNVCKAGSERMRDGGRIVNMASIAGVVGFFGQSNYAAAKAGVVAVTKVLSREVAKRRITVNAVAPGVSLTEMGKTIPEEVRAEMLKNIPLGRFAEPREVSTVILFLCSDLASYVTGQTVHVNGGWWG